VKIKVEWELDGLSLDEAGVPEVVEVPRDIYTEGLDCISDWLSDTYGWCHQGWVEWKP
jgi:hypothetical protein